MANNFLPDNYEVPSSSNNYMKFEEGKNKFRILSKPIIGWEWWVDTDNGKRQPIRTPMNEKPKEIVDYKHFWAMVVWNYQAEAIQVLEITQKKIQNAIQSLAQDEGWGNPMEYDLVVERTGKELNTEYTIMPRPLSRMDEKIKIMADTVLPQIKLEALYAGEDPFADVELTDNTDLVEGAFSNEPLDQVPVK